MFLAIGRSVVLLLVVVGTSLLLKSEDRTNQGATVGSVQKVASISQQLVLATQDGNGPTRLDVQLGSYRPGTILKCEIKVENQTGKLLDYSRIETGCSCLTVAPMTGRFSPKDQLTFSLQIKTPARPSAVDQSVSFIAYDNEFLRFVVRVNYSLNGIVGFRDDFVQILIPEGSGDAYSAVLHIFADEHSPEEFIDIEASESIENLGITLEYAKRELVVKVPELLALSGRITGEIKIKNIETNSSDNILVDIDMQSAISVFPSLLRFSKKEDVASEQ